MSKPLYTQLATDDPADVPDQRPVKGRVQHAREAGGAVSVGGARRTDAVEAVGPLCVRAREGVERSGPKSNGRVQIGKSEKGQGQGWQLLGTLTTGLTNPPLASPTLYVSTSHADTALSPGGPSTQTTSEVWLKSAEMHHVPGRPHWLPHTAGILRLPSAWPVRRTADATLSQLASAEM